MGQLAKGHQTLAHKVALLEVEVARLTEANRRLNKQKRAKKKRVQLGGSLTTDQAVDILAQRDVDIQLLQEDREGGRQRGGRRGRIRRYGIYSQPGHNRRACPVVAEVPESAIRDVIVAQL